MTRDESRAAEGRSDDLDDDDDDALSWAGDDDRAGSRADARARRAAADAAEGDADDVDAGDDEDELEVAERAAQPLGVSIATAFAGVLFAAWTVGWILSAQVVASAGGALVNDVMFQFGEFLAIVACPLWFASALRLTERYAVRLGFLALGLGVLVPWPILFQAVVQP